MKNVKIFVDERMGNNTYLLSMDKKVIIIDPSFSTRKIIDYISENDYEVVAILLTHGHFDHFAGVDKLGNLYHCDYYISEEDESFLNGKESKIFQYEVLLEPKFYPDYQLKIEGFEFELLKVPGHTPGCVVIVWDDKMFTGDFIFAGDIGRTDLPKGSSKKMQESLAMFKQIKGDFIIYPGHEESSTLAKEKATNPHLK